MATGKNKSANNNIAPDNAYQIVCPYCFNEVQDAVGGYGKPFSHRAVEFRSETYYENEAAIERALNMKLTEIEMIPDNRERTNKLKQYEDAKRFMLRADEKYQKFWENYEGQTTEKDERGIGQGNHHLWDLPIISLNNGITQLMTDSDGFVTSAIDVFGNVTHRRVCPYCHNPLPIGFGKNKVKNISVIGTTGAGKTVYISQILKGIGEYATKVGLNAFYTAQQVTDFIRDNLVENGATLPDSTSPGRLSQPMFYDIVQNDSAGRQRSDTIVIYDIAGENCRDADAMKKFANFVKHSDGLILLIDPKQLRLVPSDVDDADVPAMALNTLHNVLETEKNKKSDIPIAVCISKADTCYEILPDVASEDVRIGGLDINRMPTKMFDGQSYNVLEKKLTDLMLMHAMPVCNILKDTYLNYNFFSVSAIGSDCVENGVLQQAPTPRRIEEPILWLFKQFGFIGSNKNVLRPFKIPNADKYTYKKPLIGKAVLIKHQPTYATYEEDKIELYPLVYKKGEWEPMSEAYDGIEIKTEGGE